jgi:hypothetical protein
VTGRGRGTIRCLPRHAAAASVTFLLGAIAAPAGGVELRIVRLERGALHGPADMQGVPFPVGSLQKPFVVKAWARAHPAEATPLVLCDARSSCWRPAGHGDMRLTRATAESCNTYFLHLAAATPLRELASTLSAEGFTVPRPLSIEAAIGLPETSAVTIDAATLLRAYVRLTREPWTIGDAVRRELLEGLREAALTGTAAGLGQRNFWAKTGTVRALDGQPLATSGWAVAVDDSGWAALALLDHGTGRQAAAAMAVPLAAMRPWSQRRIVPGGPAIPAAIARVASAPPAFAGAAASARVRVGLFGPLAPRSIVAVNAGATSAATSRGYVGPGASLRLAPGDHLDEALWELRVASSGLRRRVQGALAYGASAGQATVVADVSRREYVAGVLAGELGGRDPERRVALGAAVLRFLDAGPRHGANDVCDSTHCAWFVGRGPRVLWPTARWAVTMPGGDLDELGIDAATWARIESESRAPGPRYWTAHCGGRPLSPHAVWGGADRSSLACPTHRSGSGAWSRFWPDEALARAFGSPVKTVAVEAIDGVWRLRLQAAAAPAVLHSYDRAHRMIAGALGWNALPSPADQVAREPGGFRVKGVGSGHRVGLCLGVSDAGRRLE